jgi:hypothetical protein
MRFRQLREWTITIAGAPWRAQNQSERNSIPLSDGPPSHVSPSVGRGL